MKKSPLKTILFLVVVLFAAQMTQSQGVLYVSNFGQTLTGSTSIGSDSWAAQGIETGIDSDGYVLNSVQLLMAAASGDPSEFTVSIYSVVNGLPAQDLANLSGSSDPSSAGLYTYTASGLILSASTAYCIVATAATPTDEGAFNWSGASGATSTEGLDQWTIQRSLFSFDAGLDWMGVRPPGIALETAIYATAIPEPSTWILCLLGGGFAFYIRVRKRPASQVKLD